MKKLLGVCVAIFAIGGIFALTGCGSKEPESDISGPKDPNSTTPAPEDTTGGSAGAREAGAGVDRPPLPGQPMGGK